MGSQPLESDLLWSWRGRERERQERERRERERDKERENKLRNMRCMNLEAPLISKLKILKKNVRILVSISAFVVCAG